MKTRLLITCIIVLSLVVLIPQALAKPVLAPDAPKYFDYLFTDMEGNPDRIYLTGQQIQFIKNIENDRDYVLTGDLELKLDENSRDFYEIILEYQFTVPIGQTDTPNTFWTPEQSGFYKFSIITNYDNPTGEDEGVLVHEEGFDHFTVVDKFSKAFHPDNLNCRLDFYPIVKPDYSTVVCVSNDTMDILAKRGWEPISFSTQSDHDHPITLEAIDPTKIVNANNQFAIDFYSQVTADKQENVFFSPWSISTAFAIAYEGARGNTADEMSDTFGFVKDDEERRTVFAAIHEDLNQKDARYKLNIANALWLAPDFEPFQEYVNIAKTYYDSEVETVNLVGDGVDIINDWVKTKTEGKIEEILVPGSLTAQTRMVITNAIYFNGTWVMPFEEKRTSEQDFIVNAKKTVTVPMMSQTLFFNYTKNDQLFILELPYEGDRLSMLILLPNEIDGITSLEESLTAQKISQWKNDLFERKLQVQMPKFTMETDYDLIPGLKNLGINDAFGPADFSGISNSGLYIAKAIHKAFVDVNEKGTEAAAATAIVMDESAPPTFRADHPFIFIIQDNETGIILFIGKVLDPTA